MNQKRISSKKTMSVIFLTVLIDLIGFGMIIPILPFLARKLEASAFEVGLLLTFYSGFQFLLAPIWGKLSDYFGRKPIIIIGLLGTGLAHLWFAYSMEFLMLILARIFAGGFGATISTAMAVVGDVTEKSKRSQGMGLIGAAFGLGFVIGPFLGAMLSMLGKSIGSYPPFGGHFVAFIAGIMAFLNIFFVYSYFEESLPVKNKKNLKIKSLKYDVLKGFSKKLDFKTMPWIQTSLISMFFLYSLAMSQLETCLFLFLDDFFGWGIKEASFGFAYMGFLMLVTQTYFLSRFIPMFGESRLLGIGIILSFFGYVAIVMTKSLFHLGVAVSLLGVGSALMQSLLRGSVSVLSPKEKQGATLGILHSLAALGRVFGPLMAGFFYQIKDFIPFLISAGLLLVVFLIYLRIKNKIPNPGFKNKIKRK